MSPLHIWLRMWEITIILPRLPKLWSIKCQRRLRTPVLSDTAAQSHKVRNLTHPLKTFKECRKSGLQTLDRVSWPAESWDVPLSCTKWPQCACLSRGGILCLQVPQSESDWLISWSMISKRLVVKATGSVLRITVGLWWACWGVVKVLVVSQKVHWSIFPSYKWLILELSLYLHLVEWATFHVINLLIVKPLNLREVIDCWMSFTDGWG